MNNKVQNRKLWENRIKDFKDSVLTIKAWCETNQLKEHQFYYWRNKFRDEKKSSTSFVPVNLTQITSQTNKDSTIKIHIGSFSLEIQSGFNPSQLKEVMKVLMEVCKYK